MPNRLLCGVIFLTVIFSACIAFISYHIFLSDDHYQIQRNNKLRFVLFIIQFLFSIYMSWKLIKDDTEFNLFLWLFPFSGVNLGIYAFGEMFIFLNHGRLFIQMPNPHSKSYDFQMDWVNFYLQMSTNFLLLFILSSIGLMFIRYQQSRNEQRFQFVIDNLKSQDYYSQINQNQNQHQKNTCSICLDYLQKQRVLKLPTCGHYFHKDCLVDWIKRNTICPLCRNDIHSAIETNGSQRVQFVENY